jgi:hypothetical protein
MRRGTMFYDALGELLAYAAQALATDVRPHVGDDPARTQLDAVAALCADIGAMWPDLFRALAEENRILERALGEECDATDELGRYRVLIAKLGEQLTAARTLPGGEAGERLERLRGAMSAAARVQDEMVRAAMSSKVDTVKRV